MKAFIALAMLAMVCVCSARELHGAQLDITVSNCRTHGLVGGRRVCTRCHNNHVLVPGGTQCVRSISGCRNYGWVGGRWACTACVDNRPLLPGGMECRSSFGH